MKEEVEDTDHGLVRSSWQGGGCNVEGAQVWDGARCPDSA